MNNISGNTKRTAIFTRSPLIDRYSISSKVVRYAGCSILSNNTDCSGTNFSTFPDYEDPRTILIVLESENHDWDELIELILLCKERHRYIRIVTEVIVPMKILCAFTYHPYNVIQYNIDLTRHDQYTAELMTSIYNAKICGAYITVFLYPVIPTITTVFNVIEMTTIFKNLSDHMCIKLLEVDQELEPVNGFYNVNGRAVPEKYMERESDGVLRCSKCYKSAFSNALMKYTIPNKVNLSICDQGKCY